MGPPYRSDVWAWAQSNVQWWTSIRSAGRACSCGFLVDTSLQIRQTSQAQRAPESAGECKWAKHGECRRGNSVRQPIRDDVVDGRHHCQCYLRSLEYCRFAAAWRLTHNKMLLLVLGHCWVRLKHASLQGFRLTACTFPTQDHTPSTTRGLQPSCLDTYSAYRNCLSSSNSS